jgi:hypothetical protein
VTQRRMLRQREMFRPVRCKGRLGVRVLVGFDCGRSRSQLGCRCICRSQSFRSRLRLDIIQVQRIVQVTVRCSIHFQYKHWEQNMHPKAKHTNEATSSLVVGTLKDGYIQRVPLPRVPRIQNASLATRKPSRCIMAGHEPSRCTMVGNASAITYYWQVPQVPTWSDLTRSPSGFGRRTLLPFFPVRLM